MVHIYLLLSQKIKNECNPTILTLSGISVFVKIVSKKKKMQKNQKWRMMNSARKFMKRKKKTHPWVFGSEVGKES